MCPWESLGNPLGIPWESLTKFLGNPLGPFSLRLVDWLEVDGFMMFLCKYFQDVLGGLESLDRMVGSFAMLSYAPALEKAKLLSPYGLQVAEQARGAGDTSGWKCQLAMDGDE